MRIFGATTIELREPAHEQERARRLAELQEEITALRGTIRRSLDDENLVLRIRPNNQERESELWELRAERERAESALQIF